VHIINFPYDFYWLQKKCKGRLLIVLFIAFTCDRKYVYDLNDISRHGNLKHVEFALIRIDLQTYIRESVELDSLIPELRFYKGDEIIAKQTGDVFAIFENINMLSNECLQWPGYEKTKYGFFHFIKKLVLVSIGLVESNLVQYTLTRIVHHNISRTRVSGKLPSRPHIDDNFDAANNSLYLPTRPFPRKIQFLKIDGSMKYSINRTQFMCKPSTLVWSTSYLPLFNSAQTTDNFLRKDTIQPSNKVEIIEYFKEHDLEKTTASRAREKLSDFLDEEEKLSDFLDEENTAWNCLMAILDD